MLSRITYVVWLFLILLQINKYLKMLDGKLNRRIIFAENQN